MAVYNKDNVSKPVPSPIKFGQLRGKILCAVSELGPWRESTCHPPPFLTSWQPEHRGGGVGRLSLPEKKNPLGIAEQARRHSDFWWFSFWARNYIRESRKNSLYKREKISLYKLLLFSAFLTEAKHILRHHLSSSQEGQHYATAFALINMPGVGICQGTNYSTTLSQIQKWCVRTLLLASTVSGPWSTWVDLPQTIPSTWVARSLRSHVSSVPCLRAFSGIMGACCVSLWATQRGRGNDVLGVALNPRGLETGGYPSSLLILHWRTEEDSLMAFQRFLRPS